MVLGIGLIIIGVIIGLYGIIGLVRINNIKKRNYMKDL
jgi:multisubunit Na+/H+ antiporter MnhG subunit